MADDHSATATASGNDMPEHEATFAGFVTMTEIAVVALICIILELVLWGLEGHGFVALVGFVLTLGAMVFGSLSGLNWRAVVPVLVLMGLACIVL